jgi:hypothetical protein
MAGRTLTCALLILLMLASCQQEDVIVQSLFDLSGAPLAYDDSQATRHLYVAAASIEPTLDKAQNLEQLKMVSLCTKPLASSPSPCSGQQASGASTSC